MQFSTTVVGSIISAPFRVVGWGVGYIFGLNGSDDDDANSSNPIRNSAVSPSSAAVPYDNTASTTQDTAEAHNHNQYDAGVLVPLEYFFANHFADAKKDFQFLASRYHEGVKRGAAAVAAANKNKNGNASPGPNRPSNDANQFHLCKICAQYPATFFASELNGVFVENEKSARNNSVSSNDASTSVSICFECFILAFRSLVLPELVSRDKKQTDAILEMITILEEASLVDTCGTPKEADENQEGDANKFKNSKKSNTARESSVSSNSSQKDVKRLLCPSCHYPCAETDSYCKACGSHTPWSIQCLHCKCSVTNAPPICVKSSRAHVQWLCETCTFINTVDVPACEQCETKRTWKCPRCFAANRSLRTAQGQRNCFKCGYCFTDMSTTTIRKFGLQEEAVRQADKATHDRERATYKIDQKMLVLFSAETIQERAAKHKTSAFVASLFRVPQDGDGNCAFRSISFNLFGTPNGHMLVRKAICAGLNARKNLLLPWFENDAAFTRYIALMEHSGNWADEMVLRVAAQVFGVHIHIVSSDDESWHLHFSPYPAFMVEGLETEEKNSSQDLDAVAHAASKKTPTKKQKEENERLLKEKEDSRPHIFLAYSAPVHYDSLVIAFTSTNKKNQQGNLTSSSSTIKPVSIPQLIKNLAESFVQEEDEWVDTQE